MTPEVTGISPRAMRVNDASEYTSISVSTLNKLRLTGGGPTYVKIGKSVVYLISDLDAWLEAKRQKTTIDNN
ncbi:helix-turn-helix transcriptional regulator [Rhizobium laguerreae]|uniref:Helix-turn-helix domain-containing protein n=1 Tax=Rhizobium laguerreae TaxID=1076926 RepID=A0A7Y2RBB8_9HYPH|nr:helix-turn-helix domain-containing protein [Rhizobium laguerreae]NNH67831.1 helix-turn-helix domain-containing protein [Rhizobium laguerreae]